jgi:glutamate---cysteine ligase / carboxylate-amine ligase
VTLDLTRARELFESSTDFTIGIEEEFAIVDPDSLELEQRFEELYEACQGDDLLADSAAGELIASEIEIRSGRNDSFAEAMERQREHRSRLFALADARGIGLAATGTHPWANYLDQRIIDTPHYQRLRRDLGYVVQRNNTWSMHVHMGVRGADRAIAVCDALRGVLPLLLAASANSPFLDRRDTGYKPKRSGIEVKDQVAEWDRAGTSASADARSTTKRVTIETGDGDKIVCDAEGVGHNPWADDVVRVLEEPAGA